MLAGLGAPWVTNGNNRMWSKVLAVAWGHAETLSQQRGAKLVNESQTSDQAGRGAEDLKSLPVNQMASKEKAFGKVVTFQHLAKSSARVCSLLLSPLVNNLW